MHECFTKLSRTSGQHGAASPLVHTACRPARAAFRTFSIGHRTPADAAEQLPQEDGRRRPGGRRQQHTSAHDSCTRRQALELAAAIIAMPAAISSPAEAVLKGGGRGINRYIKKKSLDPLDTYVPPVLQARQQLQQAGEIMGKDAGSARSLLREGAFDGLRDNIRALGEYAEQNGVTKDGSGLVNGFFKALEAYDLRLFEAGRFSRPVAEGTDEVLDQAVKSLDRLLETVPAGDLTKAKEILRVLSDVPSADAGNDPKSMGEGADVEQRLILPSAQ